MTGNGIAWQGTSESWRRAHGAWQRWAARLLRDLGGQSPGGEWGDGPARKAIARLARRGAREPRGWPEAKP